MLAIVRRRVRKLCRIFWRIFSLKNAATTVGAQILVLAALGLLAIVQPAMASEPRKITLVIVYECALEQELEFFLHSLSPDTVGTPSLSGHVRLHPGSQSEPKLCQDTKSISPQSGLSRGFEVKLEKEYLGSTVADEYPFFGLSEFYNRVAPIQFSGSGKITNNVPWERESAHQPGEWFGWKGRYRVAMMSAPGASVQQSADEINIAWPRTIDAQWTLYVGEARNVSAAGYDAMQFATLRYSQLWPLLSMMSSWVEKSICMLREISKNWGVAIVFFALFLRLLLLPLSLLTDKWQREVVRIQTTLAPVLAEVKAHYDGEEAHNRIMAAHKALGVTPFYTLKPLFSTLIQIPILIAIFNALGEMPQLQGEKFLWILDLAYPDAVYALPLIVPYMGDTLNILPFIMMAVGIVAALFFKIEGAPVLQERRQRWNLYAMAVVFFVLFYPFPAAMVLYWTLSNALQFVQQLLIKAWLVKQA